MSTETLQLIAIIVAALLAVLLSQYISNKQEKIKQMKPVETEAQKAAGKAYEDALKKSDKATALALGRTYYKMLRGSEYTALYDECTMANDISAMS